MKRLSELFETIQQQEKQLNDKYPDRHATIHKVCCKECPSEHNRKLGKEDGESADIKASFSKEQIAKEYLFVCAWRQSKLCKGLCDYMEIDQSYLDRLK